jgi:hypothetical protein
VLVFQSPFDDRAQFEAKARGYLSHVLVEMSDGRRYPVVFYDCVRLAQDLEAEVAEGRACVADAGMIVLPEVSLEHMRAAVQQLVGEGFFERLVPERGSSA